MRLVVEMTIERIVRGSMREVVVVVERLSDDEDRCRVRRRVCRWNRERGSILVQGDFHISACYVRVEKKSLQAGRISGVADKLRKISRLFPSSISFNVLL
jgi:hypothetical protein